MTTEKVEFNISKEPFSLSWMPILTTSQCKIVNLGMQDSQSYGPKQTCWQGKKVKMRVQDSQCWSVLTSGLQGQAVGFKTAKQARF